MAHRLIQLARARRWGVPSLAALLLAAVACAPAATPPPANPTAAQAQPAAPRTIKIDVANTSAPYAWYYVGQAKGYFAEEGIQLEPMTTNGSVGIPSVLSGEMPFTTGAAASLSAILKGGDLRVVFANLDRPSFELWTSRPDIRTLQDLVGQTVGVIGRGDTTEISTRLALQGAGIDPDSVAYTPLGGGQERLAALLAGSVAAAPLGVADVQRLKQSSGYNGVLVANLRDSRMMFNGLATSERVIRQDPALVEGFTRAILKSRLYFRAHKEETLQILEQASGSGREIVEPDYDSALATMTPDGTIDEDTQRADTQVRAALIGVPVPKPIDQIYDFSFVRKVDDELARTGWQPEP